MPSLRLALEWLAGLAWITAIRESTLGAPIIQTAHVASTVVLLRALEERSMKLGLRAKVIVDDRLRQPGPPG